MVTRRFLRLALLGLLGFMIFCLVVMELALHRNQWVRVYQQLAPMLTGRATGNATTTTTTTMKFSSVPILKVPVKNVTALRVLVQPGRDLKPPDGVRISSISLSPGHPANVSVNVVRASTTAGRPSNASLLVNHCQENGVSPTESRGFSLGGQKLPDGSRPQNCSHCFHSRFTPLLQSCRVCNTDSGGGGAPGMVGAAVEVVMMILTTHQAVDKRQAIRRSWASVTRNNTAHVRHVFVLGRSKTEADMQRVRKEHQVYGDIIMYDFIDAYANLTLKTLTCMHWVLDYCSNARFILKADDDMWINVPTLLSTVKREETVLQTAIGGACRMAAGPIRNRHSKWYASEKDYPQKAYPGFCSGTAYVTSVNVARHVLSVSPDVPFFYLEDVYMALCIKKLGPPFRLQRLDGFFHGGGPPCVLRGKGTISVHEVKPSTLLNIWNAKCP